jgi:hypothetical protein
MPSTVVDFFYTEDVDQVGTVYNYIVGIIVLHFLIKTMTGTW